MLWHSATWHDTFSIAAMPRLVIKYCIWQGDDTFSIVTPKLSVAQKFYSMVDISFRLSFQLSLPKSIFHLRGSLGGLPT